MKNHSIHIANTLKYGYAEHLSKFISVTPQRHCGFIVPKFSMDSRSMPRIGNTSVLATQTRLKSLYEGMTLQNMALPNMQGGSDKPRVNPLTLISQIKVNQITQNYQEAIMPNQKNSTIKNNAQNTPKTYTTGDMVDAYSVAEYDMNWMQTALNRVRDDFIKLSESLQKQSIHSIYFDELQTVLDMYSYIAEKRHSHHAEMAERYKQELDVNKEAVTL